MFSHVVVGSNDLERSKKFYDAVFGAMGGNPGMQADETRLVYAHNGGMLLVGKPIDGKPATSGNGATIGFACASGDEIDAWYKAGVENGGEGVEDPPGIRESDFGKLYLAYLRDPDGNKLCGFHRDEG